MSTTNQGTSFAGIEQMVAQQVANAIETIAIYEAKTRMARDLINRVERQKDKVANNASNKKKWGNNHSGSSSQNKGHKVIRVHTAEPSNKKGYAGNLPLLDLRRLLGQRVVREAPELHRETHNLLHLERSPARIGPKAYQLESPKELSDIRNTFHTSNLKKRMSNESLVLPLEGLQVDNKLNFIEEPVEIMGHEDKFQRKYPHFSVDPAPSSNTMT
ncbi:hypothetical protein Tco_0529961 [Tanacetum coccineum]